MNKKESLEKFQELITCLNQEQLEELYEEIYPSDVEKDLEQECIDYFEWVSDNPKRQKELINFVEEQLGEKELVE